MSTTAQIKPIILLDDATAIGPGPIKYIRTNGIRGMYGLVQVSIVGTNAEVTIEGRMDETFPWETIKTVTASEAFEAVLFNQMRASVGAITAATARAGLLSKEL